MPALEPSPRHSRLCRNSRGVPFCPVFYLLRYTPSPLTTIIPKAQPSVLRDFLYICREITSAMKIIDEKLVNDLATEAKQSPRLRMNYNFHQSLEDKCHRFLNALEPGTQVPIHHHPTKDETFVILKGRVRVTIYNDEGKVVESCVLSHEDGVYGADIPKNAWHGIECLEPSVLLECKEGPFVEHEVDGILQIDKGSVS